MPGLLLFAYCYGLLGLASIQVSAYWMTAQIPLQLLPVVADKPSVTNKLLRRCKLVLFANTHSPGAPRGTVIASPSHKNPDYYYHWVRDASISFMSVLDMIQSSSQDPAQPHPELERLLDDYAQLSKQHQESPFARSGLGEPKFYVDGSPFMAEWGRPQNDGPALRALVLVEYAQFILKHRPSRKEFVQTLLYDSRLPTQSVIKRDLEYISQQWHAPSFDLWEESLGTHFFTRMVQHAALVSGAQLAMALNDRPAADWYLIQAQHIESALHLHWDPIKKYLLATVDWKGGLSSKTSQLDIAVIIASLVSTSFNSTHSAIYAPWDDRILSTLIRYTDTMSTLYPINANTSAQVVVGRYPEDVYDGLGFSKGNPWPLATCALAEHVYNVVGHWCQARSILLTYTTLDYINRYAGSTISEPIGTLGGSIIWTDKVFKQIVQALVQHGDKIIDRVSSLSNLEENHGNLELSEQWNASTGAKQGAQLLTWSAVSLLRAIRSRKQTADNCHPLITNSI
ncbi:hypothetical protein MT418_005809 [Batrachochytrium dendrobatidis]